MKIAINARLLQKNKLEGIGTFMDEVLQRIVRLHPEIEFHFIFDHSPNPDFIYEKNVTPHVILPPTKHVAIFDFWFNWRIPQLLKKIDADYFLSLDGITSTKLTIPNHLVIHDLNFEHRPLDLPKAPRNYYLKRSKKFAQNCTQIATVSNYSKNDISSTYQIDPAKIDVVFNAAKTKFKPLSTTEITNVQQQYSKGKPYFLYLGSLHPRKNLNNLMKGFLDFKAATNSNHKLMIVGNVMWETKGLQQILSNNKFQNDVVFTGRKSDEELVQIMGGAYALTYIPFFEGFGIPIVEAYASGIPVITSNTTSLPEIAGEGAILVAPHIVDEIANAMKQLHENPTLRAELIKKGQIQNQQFSWDKTAKLYWNSVEKIFK